MSDFIPDAGDLADWLSCHDLVFGAGSGTLGDPIAFELKPSGEEMLTAFAPGLPDVDLAQITADPREAVRKASGAVSEGARVAGFRSAGGVRRAVARWIAAFRVEWCVLVGGAWMNEAGKRWRRSRRRSRRRRGCS